jgi:hypothetical protein
MWPAKVDVEIASVVSEWVGVVQIPRRFGCRGLCFTSVDAFTPSRQTSPAYNTSLACGK